MKPHGFVCYAAHPNSFIIGADGRVYKCTVALGDPRNHVGWVRPDGRMELDLDRVALWTIHDAAEDASCRHCFLRPACQGVACPLKRFETGKPPCPDVKHDLRRVLTTLARANQKKVGTAQTEMGPIKPSVVAE